MIDNVYVRAAAQAQNEIVKPIRNSLVGRRLASINPYLKGDGRNILEVNTIRDLTDAFVQYNAPNGTEHKDSLVISRELIQALYLYKEFTQSRNDILAWDNRKVAVGEENSLQSLGAEFAARKVAEQEEQLIFDGWKPDGTNYTIKGFSQIAGNSITGGSISTPGTMYRYVTSGIGALQDDGVFGDGGKYNLSLTPTIYSALMANLFTNTGVCELDIIKNRLNGGEIFVTPKLPTGVAIITPVDTARQHFEFLNPVDYTVEFKEPDYPRLSDVEGIAYELFVPHYMRVSSGVCDAVCKITSLTA